ncbi:hypothetical protein IAU59_005692 [Kwoniella sp. CBS 9459]
MSFAPTPTHTASLLTRPESEDSNTDWSISLFDSDGTEHVSQALDPVAQSLQWSSKRGFSGSWPPVQPKNTPTEKADTEQAKSSEGTTVTASSAAGGATDAGTANNGPA